MLFEPIINCLTVLFARCERYQWNWLMKYLEGWWIILIWYYMVVIGQWVELELEWSRYYEMERLTPIFSCTEYGRTCNCYFNWLLLVSGSMKVHNYSMSWIKIVMIFSPLFCLHGVHHHHSINTCCNFLEYLKYHTHSTRWSQVYE